MEYQNSGPSGTLNSFESFVAVKMPILINRKDVVTSLRILSPVYWDASVLRVMTAFLFMSEEWGCERSLWRYVWWGEGELFGSPPFQVFVAFSVGQISALIAAILLILCPFTRKDFVLDCHTARGPDGTVMQPSGLLVLFVGRAVTHASLSLFSRRTNTSSVLHALRAYVLILVRNWGKIMSLGPYGLF